MKLITNTNEIKYGDIILGLPGKYKYDSFIRVGPKGIVKKNNNDFCFDIYVPPEDTESFAEECYIAKCIMIDSGLYFVDLKTNDTFYWDKDVDTICVPYTIWKLDIKI